MEDEYFIRHCLVLSSAFDSRTTSRHSEQSIPDQATTNELLDIVNALYLHIFIASLPTSHLARCVLFLDCIHRQSTLHIETL